jgi:hypothetical protein
MPFRSGHKKQGGRKAGTPNRLTGEAREVARRLLGDPEYQRSLLKRLRLGEAPRVELHIWELAYGKPRPHPDDFIQVGMSIFKRTPKKRDPDFDLMRWLASSDRSSNASGT